MNIDDNYFKEKFKSNQIFKSKIKSLNNDELTYLLNRYNDSLSIKETIFRILNNIDNHPICPECGKPTKVKYRKEKPFFSTCCDPECIHKRKGNGPKEACIKKYGVNNVFQIDFVKEKIKNNHLKKYGYKSHTQSNEWKQRQTNTLLEKYNVTCQFQRKEIKEKIKNTCLQKYGVDHYNKSDDFKNKMSKIASSEDFQNKRNNTLKLHKSWNTSKDEEYINIKLNEVFNIVKRQYKSELYPFNCDFYIEDIDTYIEYQGSDLHNKKPYLGTLEDINEINLLKEKSQIIKNKTGKNKTRYDNRILTWSVLDVKKRNIAKNNNLNFIEFWNIVEFNDWINNYKYKNN